MVIGMKVSHSRDHAILAVLASTVSAKTFDRLFAGANVEEIDGDVLYVRARNEQCAVEIENRFAMHIASIATHVFRRRIDLVIAVPSHPA
jgi:hypothetical protein